MQLFFIFILCKFFSVTRLDYRFHAKSFRPALVFHLKNQSFPAKFKMVLILNGYNF